MDEQQKKMLMEAMMQLPNKEQVQERSAMPQSEEDELAGLRARLQSVIPDESSFEDKLNRAARMASLEAKEDPMQFTGMSGGIRKLAKNQMRLPNNDILDLNELAHEEKLRNMADAVNEKLRGPKPRNLKLKIDENSALDLSELDKIDKLRNAIKDTASEFGIGAAKINKFDKAYNPNNQLDYNAFDALKKLLSGKK
jgi:hypothetical protein